MKVIAKFAGAYVLICGLVLLIFAALGGGAEELSAKFGWNIWLTIVVATLAEIGGGILWIETGSRLIRWADREMGVG